MTDKGVNEILVIDLSDWSRGAEVLAYSEKRGVPVDRAIEELVNSGLSHDHS